MSHLMSTQFHDLKCACTLALLSATHLRTSDESRTRETPRLSCEIKTTGSKTGPEHRPPKGPTEPSTSSRVAALRDSMAGDTETVEHVVRSVLEIVPREEVMIVEVTYVRLWDFFLSTRGETRGVLSVFGVVTLNTSSFGLYAHSDQDTCFMCNSGFDLTALT